ncbi:MAG: tRNA preQ1(34) S-adenosylmethionine ribosyltransferase-isomerase QueA [Buchnera aphidicola (Pentalonia nigronervosa)]|jgi:S-adenosylmethionine:tRNA ribosyltransferase-isomerase|uniref:S-adenosylmethionine:tRNA ribosyltransferase-isomerase n=1 Tax=Buchnera aphidicola (Pentalonia nigronervosa) TaxID=1309793 RepID=A0A7H1AZF9_9GAMM|nr:MAG: tRNA preQ1(34) S-adenosylmethionine ribosyltransferase-isomerase QueA [Buchnera aphidicola (Pentalonia nigronervosa)]
MQISDFSFVLPKSLIAFYPCFKRTKCRLLVMNGNTGTIFHTYFFNIIHEINAGDLIIFNDTEVIPARLLGYKKNGSRIEILIERILNKSAILAKIKKSKSIKIGSSIFFGKNNCIKADVINYKNSFFKILFDSKIYSVLDVISIFGKTPLPPYIKRPVNASDSDLYQTVYKKKIGSIAAPTAGLHFDHVLLDALDKKGINIDYLTLHIGSGTFEPIRVVKLEEHVMHSELIEISSSLIQKIKLCKKNGGRVIAVGTTTLRALESVYNSHAWNSSNNFSGETDIFIYPGYKHNVVDGLITNFHVPQSTLIMLVASFAGYENTMHAYYEAIRKKYRFFSYGDAMYVTLNKIN